MTGMALFPGLSDKEGRVLGKVDRLAQAADALAQAGRMQRAASALLRALNLLESSRGSARTREGAWSEAYARIGGGLLALRQTESAATAVVQALTLNPSNGRALGVQGDILLGRGGAAEAIPYYDAALRFDSRAKFVWEHKGDAHAALGQRPEAIRAYVQVVNLDPDDVEGYDRILALVPQDIDLWVRKGHAHRRREEFNDAHEAYDRALRLASDRRDALEGKAHLYLSTNAPDKALPGLDRARGAPAANPQELGGARLVRPGDRGGAEGSGAPRRTPRSAPRARALGGRGPGGGEDPRVRAPARARPVREGPGVPRDEPEGRGAPRARRVPRRRAALVRRAGREAPAPPRLGPVARRDRDVRRDPLAPAAQPPRPEGQGPRSPCAQASRGRVRGVRPGARAPAG